MSARSATHRVHRGPQELNQSFHGRAAEENHFGSKFFERNEPMKSARIKICCCWLLFSMLTSSGQSQKASGQDVPESPSDFVRKFYAWYVPRTLSDNSIPAFEFTLKNKKAIFTPILDRKSTRLNSSH